MDWIYTLPSKNIIEYLKNTKPPIVFNNKSSKKSILSDIVADIVSLFDAGRIGIVIDKIALGLYLDKSYVLEQLKKSGRLRHSRYLGRKNPISGIAKKILDNEDLIPLTIDERNYFKSLINFEVAYKELDKLNKCIIRGLADLRYHDKITIAGGSIKASKIKALLALNEFNFIVNKTEERSLHDLSYYEYFSKEEISESISYLINRYNETFGITADDLGMANSKFIKTKDAELLLVNTCRFKAIRELEIELESYSFECLKNGNKILIAHPEDDFCKSIELSNIHYVMQQLANSVNFHESFNNAATLSEISEKFHEKLPQLFVLKKEPTERYVISVPEIFFDKFLKDDMEYFREELGLVYSIAAELLIPLEDMKKYEIRPGFTFHDFLVLFRFFIIHSSLISTKITEIMNDVNTETVIKSLVAVFEDDTLVKVLTRYLDKEKVNVFLDLVSWDTSKKGQFLDLQYKPIIKYENKYLASICLMGISNLPRNIFPAESKAGNNIKSTGNNKEIPEILERAFKLQSFATAKEIKVKYHSKVYQQSESDIDFAAYRDGVLIIAECKDNIHPVDVYELRTTYYHIKKAETQINYLLEALTNEHLIQSVCRRLDIDRIKIEKIQPIIILSNNKFWGYAINNIPIRNFREIINFINLGIWNFRQADGKILEFKLWKDHVFAVSDLVEYCGVNSAHKISYNACAEILVKFSDNIFKKTYSLLPDKLIDNMKATYPH